jgi:hypothetical protein
VEDDTMRKNIFVIFLFIGIFFLCGTTKVSAIGPDEEELKGGACLHSMPDSADIMTSDSLVVDTAGLVCTWWIQLWPCYNTYHIVGYHDNGDGKLSPSDKIQMDLRRKLNINGDPGSGWTYWGPGVIRRWYHVDVVTITLKLKKQADSLDSCFVDYISPPSNYLSILTNPLVGTWKMRRPPSYPDTANLDIDSAYKNPEHTTPADTLRRCIYVHFAGDSWWHVEEVRIDILVSKCPPPGVPTLTQWGIIVLVALLISSAVFIGLRRRRAAVPA